MGFEGALAAQLGQAPGNYVVSPASVLLGLAMAREGARGDSAAAFDAVLGADARSVRSGYWPSCPSHATSVASVRSSCLRSFRARLTCATTS